MELPCPDRTGHRTGASTAGRSATTRPSASTPPTSTSASTAIRCSHELINSVEKQLRNEAPGIRVIIIGPWQGNARRVQAQEGRGQSRGVAIDATTRRARSRSSIRTLTDYRTGNDRNTNGKGSRSLVQRRIGDDSESDVKWETFEQSSRVLARWVFQREVTQTVRRRLMGDADLDSEVRRPHRARQSPPTCTSSRSPRTSPTPTSTTSNSFRNASTPTWSDRSSPALTRSPSSRTPSTRATTGLNPLEARFAKVLDKQGVPWARNPPRTGYGIPLPSYGPTHNFYPDFIVWVDDEDHHRRRHQGRAPAHRGRRPQTPVRQPSATRRRRVSRTTRLRRHLQHRHRAAVQRRLHPVGATSGNRGRSSTSTPWRN